MFFVFPHDARWNAARATVEFGIGIGEYQGIVRIPRDVFRRFLDGSPTPERCLAAYYLQRTRFELVAERKLRDRRLTDDGNVEITGRDLRGPKPGRSKGPLSPQTYRRRFFDSTALGRAEGFGGGNGS